MKTLIAGACAVLLLTIASVGVAHAEDAPRFMKETWPSAGVEAAWQEFQAVMDPDGALDAKTKELIGLATAAQIPCEYCIYYHTAAAKAHGATDDEIKEALASAALVRKWSTVLNGSDYSREAWREEVDAIFSGE